MFLPVIPCDLLLSKKVSQISNFHGSKIYNRNIVAMATGENWCSQLLKYIHGLSWLTTCWLLTQVNGIK